MNGGFAGAKFALPPVGEWRDALNARLGSFAARTTDVDADGRSFRKVALIILTIAVLRLSYVVSSRVPSFSDTMLRDVLIGVALLVLSEIAAKRHLAEASLVLRAGSLLGLTASSVQWASLSVFHTGRNFPLADRAFEAADRWLGLNWLAYARFVDSFPFAWNITVAAYGSIFAQFGFAIFILAFSRSAHRLYAYLLAQTLTITVVTAVACFLPAIGAYEQAGASHAGLLHAFATADTMTSSIAWLRGSDMSEAGGVTCFTLISFPSFHAGSAVLFSWASWRVAYLRWAVLALNVAMAFGTPVHGSHYFCDVIAGAFIAATCILVSKLILARIARQPKPLTQSSLPLRWLFASTLPTIAARTVLVRSRLQT